MIPKTRGLMMECSKWLVFFRRYKLEGLFLFIMGLARSRNELRRIHDKLLPPHCRLLRADFLDFQQLWQEWVWGNKPPSGGESPSDALIQGVICSTSVVMPNSGFWDYYQVALEKDRSTKDLFDADVVYSRVERYQHGCEHFEAMLFEHKFRISCRILGDKFWIGLILFRPQLTEPLTHKLLNELPESLYAPRCRLGSDVDFWWEFELGQFNACVERQIWNDLMVAREGFTQLVEVSLNGLGIPVSDTRLIMEPFTPFRDQPPPGFEQQTWFCTPCSKRGVVRYLKDEGDVLSVARNLRAHHRQHSPDCKAFDIRVLGKKVSEEERATVMALELVE